MADRFLVYILANLPAPRPVLYTGITGDLQRRLAEHQQNPQGFLARYNLTTLAYFECTADVLAAIEKRNRSGGGAGRGRLRSSRGRTPGGVSERGSSSGNGWRVDPSSLRDSG